MQWSLFYELVHWGWLHQQFELLKLPFLNHTYLSFLGLISACMDISTEAALDTEHTECLNMNGQIFAFFLFSFLCLIVRILVKSLNKHESQLCLCFICIMYDPNMKSNIGWMGFIALISNQICHAWMFLHEYMGLVC